jgi:uncharacterized membrane protein
MQRKVSQSKQTHAQRSKQMETAGIAVQEFFVPAKTLGIIVVYWVIMGGGYAVLLNQDWMQWLETEANEIATVVGVGLVTLPPLFLVFPHVVVFLVYAAFTCTGIWHLLRRAYNRSNRNQSGVEQVTEKAKIGERHNGTFSLRKFNVAEEGGNEHGDTA